MNKHRRLPRRVFAVQAQGITLIPMMHSSRFWQVELDVCHIHTRPCSGAELIMEVNLYPYKIFSSNCLCLASYYSACGSDFLLHHIMNTHIEDVLSTSGFSHYSCSKRQNPAESPATVSASHCFINKLPKSLLSFNIYYCRIQFGYFSHFSLWETVNRRSDTWFIYLFVPTLVTWM